MHTATLYDMKNGECAVIENINISGDIRQRLFDLGFIKDSRVLCVGHCPCGDPAAYLIRGAVIALRSEESRNITVRKIGAERI